jgi:hypothetical protein
MRSPKRIPTTCERLEKSATIIEMLEQRREMAEDTNLGSNIERMIVSRELDELEEDISLNPGPLAAFVARPVRRGRAT